MPGVRQLRHVTPKPTTAINQDEWLLKSIDTHLEKTTRRTNVGVFYPSSLGNPCDRFLYLAYNGDLPEQTISPELQRIFDCGDALGYRFEKYFEKMGILISTESQVKCEDTKMSGRIDFIIKHEGIQDRAVIELKSINSRGFKALLDRPKPEHVIQTQIYLHLSNIKHGIVLYENKNDQHTKAFVVNYDENVWNKLVERCHKIMAMREIPARCTGPKYCQCRGVA